MVRYKYALLFCNGFIGYVIPRKRDFLFIVSWIILTPALSKGEEAEMETTRLLTTHTALGPTTINRQPPTIKHNK